MKKFAQISFALLAGAAAALALTLKSDVVSQNLLQRLQAIAWLELGQELEVDALEVSLVPFGVEVRGVAITDQVNPEPWLKVAALDVSLGWNLRSSTPKIRFASVRQVTFTRLPSINRGPASPGAGESPSHQAQSQPSHSTQQPPAILRKLGDYIDYLELIDLDLYFRAPDQDVHIQDFDILARATSSTSWQLGLKANQVTTSGDVTVEDGSFNGSSFITIEPSELRVALSGFKLETLANYLELQGQWNLTADASKDNRLQFKLGGNLDSLQQMLPNLKADGWQGKLNLDGELSGELGAPIYAWTVDIDELVTPQIPLGSLTMSGSGDLDQLTLTTLSLSGQQGDLSGELALDFASRTLNSQLRAERLNVGAILEMLDVVRAVEGSYTGDLNARGTIDPLELDLGLLGTFGTLEINDGDGLDIVSVTQLQSDINATLTKSQLTIPRARLSQPNLRVKTFGDIRFNESVHLNLTSNLEHINLGPLSPVVGLQFNGTGQGAISVDGPSNDITVSGSTHLKGFGIEGLEFGTIRSALLYKDDHLELPNLTLLRGEGVARGKVIVDVLEPGLEAELNYESMEINSLLDDLELAPELLPYVRGYATGDITLNGPISELGLTLSATGRDLVFDPLYLPAAHVEAVRVTGPDSPIIFGVLSGKDDQHSINVEVASSGNLEIDLNLKEYPFADLIIPALPRRSGDFDLAIDLDGPIDGLSGSVRLQTKAWRLDNVNLGEGSGELQFKSGQFQGDLDFPGESIQIATTGQVGDRIPISTTIEFSDLAPLVWADPETDIDLSTTGSVFIQGDLTDLPAMTADANLNAATINWNGIGGTLERAAVISYASEKFRVAELDLNLDGLLVSAMGEVPVEGSQSLQLRVLGNAGGLSPLFGSIDGLTGDVDGFIDVSGEISEPRFSGALTLNNVRGREPTLGLSFTEGMGRVTLIDRDLLIDSATMKTGDGSVNVLGKVTFFPEFKPQLQLTLNQTKLKPYPSSEAIVSGQLQVSQPAGVLVSGALEVNRATYGENVDLSRLFIRQPSMTFGTNIEEEPWDLRIQLSAPDGIFVSNNMVEAELRADLTVRGNTKRMGLIGSVVPLNGTVSYGGNEFEVESGSFDFTDEYAIRPNYATKLRADACGMDLQVNLSGESERFIVEASGEDETGVVDARDALLCAQFGIRSSEPNLSTEEQGSGLKDSLPGAVDALWRVSGMDERVRRYLPVVDEFKLTSGYSRSSKQTEPRLLVIKELGRQWELKYNGPVNEADEQHVLGLEYRLKRGLVLEGSWVSVSEASAGDLGIDLRMDWEFD